MAYMEQLQSGLKQLAAAGQTGRRSLDGMMGPVNGAISEISGAASELEGIPIVGPTVGEKLQRVMRGVNAAQAKVGQVWPPTTRRPVRCRRSMSAWAS